MAKAQFHKNQRVYVKPVGTWALVERVMPQWAKGLDEPIRIYYDVGLGRNKWQTAEDCAHHPYPGTYPIVVTGETDWGGWRVPGAEYDLYPQKIEAQARVMSAAPKMLTFITSFLDMASRTPENLSNEFLSLVQDGKNVLRFMAQEPTETADHQPHPTRKSAIGLPRA
jgi:hypothetical protein